MTLLISSYFYYSLWFPLLYSPHNFHAYTVAKTNHETIDMDRVSLIYVKTAVRNYFDFNP